MSDLLTLPVVSLARQIRAGALSSVDLVQAHIARIEAVNPVVNAVTARRFDQALREARAADARQVAGQPLPPLHGIPCSIKEFFAVTGMPWTGGMVARRHVRATEDAVAVRRLRRAGAIVLCTTNVPEGGLWMETYNDLYGRTANPWDPKRTCGGSSGGEGALVGSGATPFGLGSDVGGSIRIPAAFCGTFGHKPSSLTIPNTGQFPDASGEAERYLSTGPLTRSAADLDLLVQILAGPGDGTPVQHGYTPEPPSEDLTGLRVLALDTNGRVTPRASVRDAVQRAAQSLESRGATRIHADLPELRSAFEIWSAMLSAASDDHYAVILGQGQAISPVRELLKLPFGRSNHTFAALALTAADELTAPLSGLVSQYVHAGARLRQALHQVLGPKGVLLHPAYSRPAPRHRDAWRTALHAQYTAVFNVLEVPVTVAPAGQDTRGLPLAVQIVGAHGRDALTINVARALETDLGGWRPAPVATAAT